MHEFAPDLEQPREAVPAARIVEQMANSHALSVLLASRQICRSLKAQCSFDGRDVREKLVDPLSFESANEKMGDRCLEQRRFPCLLDAQPMIALSGRSDRKWRALASLPRGRTGQLHPPPRHHPGPGRAVSPQVRVFRCEGGKFGGEKMSLSTLWTQGIENPRHVTFPDVQSSHGRRRRKNSASSNAFG